MLCRCSVQYPTVSTFLEGHTSKRTRAWSTLSGRQPIGEKLPQQHSPDRHANCWSASSGTVPLPAGPVAWLVACISRPLCCLFCTIGNGVGFASRSV